MSTVANLRNDAAFPIYNSCPGDFEIGEGYYGSQDGVILSPTRHWCLLAEVLESAFYIRLRLLAGDKNGRHLIIAFHLETNDAGLNLQDFEKGNTVAILYPHRHKYLDGAMGIKLVALKHILPIPLSLSNLFALNDKVQAQNTPVDGKYACHTCGVRKETNQIQKCGKCGLFWYCDKVRLQQ